MDEILVLNAGMIASVLATVLYNSRKLAALEQVVCDLPCRSNKNCRKIR